MNLKCPKCDKENKSRIFGQIKPGTIIEGEIYHICRDCKKNIVIFSAGRTAIFK